MSSGGIYRRDLTSRQGLAKDPNGLTKRRRCATLIPIYRDGNLNAIFLRAQLSARRYRGLVKRSDQCLPCEPKPKLLSKGATPTLYNTFGSGAKR